jgi:hypothetical protein
VEITNLPLWAAHRHDDASPDANDQQGSEEAIAVEDLLTTNECEPNYKCCRHSFDPFPL